VRQDNAGVSAARNAGAKQSSGEFLAFLDSDDTWLPDVAPRLIDVLRTYSDVDVAFADALSGNPDHGFHTSMMQQLAGVDFRHLPDRYPEPGVRLLERGPFFQRLVERNQVFLGSSVVRRSAFERVDGFDRELSGAADHEFVLRLARHGTFAFLDAPLTNYLRHADAMSADKDKMDREFAQVMRNVLQKCGDLNDEEREQVRQRLRLIMFYIAYNSYDRGDLPLARQRLRELHREFGADATTLALSAACRLPPPLLRGLRRLKRSIAGAAP